MSRLLEQLLAGRSLSEEQAFEWASALAAGEVDAALGGAMLAAMRMKGEDPGEVRGLARAMRAAAVPPELPDVGPAVDIVGTGGDGSGAVNISTGAALLTAAAGLPVVKHGNRSVSSRSGSADLLEALGLPMPLEGAGAAACLERTGFTFLFAPHHHPSMASIAPIRRAMGVRTVFNILGPLTNPASPPFGLIGAYSTDVARLMADALAGLPIDRAFVVHGEPGWDEATPCGTFTVFDVRAGSVSMAVRDPAEVGIDRCGPDGLAGGDAAANAAALRRVFEGERGPHRDALVLNAGLALEVSGRAADLAEGVAMAAAALDDGAAARMLDELSRIGAEGAHDA